MRDIVVVRDVAYPREMVWEALTDGRQLAAWLMPNDFRPEVGHRFTFTTKPAPGFDGVVRCEVLDLRAPERLVFTWKGGALDTVVSFDLSDSDPGAETVKTMRRSRTALGFKSGVSDYEIGLEVKAIYPAEIDWHGYKRDKAEFLLVYEENDDGQRFRCPGCRITEVSKKHGADGDSTYSVKILALDHVAEIAAG